MTNPLIIQILKYLRAQNSSCSLIDLVKLCQQDLVSLIAEDADSQIVIFQKNFFVMNALYQIQRDIQTEGFSLTIYPLEICLVASVDGDDKGNAEEAGGKLTTRDTDLASYYLNWSNVDNITCEEVDALFAHFWERYCAVDKVDAALVTLDLENTPDKAIDWSEIRQAYRKKIVINHPDKGGCAEDFIEIREAYEILRGRYHNHNHNHRE
jgi:hypothetical protein